MAEALILDSEALNALAFASERAVLAKRASAILRLVHDKRALVRVPSAVLAEVCRGVRYDSAINHLLNNPGIRVAELTRAAAQQAGHLLAKLKLSSAHAVNAFVVATLFNLTPQSLLPATQTTSAGWQHPFDALPSLRCERRCASACQRARPTMRCELATDIAPESRWGIQDTGNCPRDLWLRAHERSKPRFSRRICTATASGAVGQWFESTGARRAKDAESANAALAADHNRGRHRNCDTSRIYRA